MPGDAKHSHLENIICPLDLDTIEDAVVSPHTGTSYSRITLTHWLKRKTICPESKKRLEAPQLISNVLLIKAIRAITTESINESILADILASQSTIQHNEQKTEIKLQNKKTLIRQPMSSTGFLCPLSKKLLTDAIINLDGDSYDRTAYIKWLKMKVRFQVAIRRNEKKFIPNVTLKNLINEILDKKLIRPEILEDINTVTKRISSISKREALQRLEKAKQDIIHAQEDKKRAIQNLKQLMVFAITFVTFAYLLKEWLKHCDTETNDMLLNQPIILTQNSILLPSTVGLLNPAIACKITRELWRQHIVKPDYQDHSLPDTPLTIARIEKHIRHFTIQHHLFHPDFYTFCDHLVHNDFNTFKKMYDLLHINQSYQNDSDLHNYQQALKRYIQQKVELGDVDSLLELIKIPNLLNNYRLLLLAAKHGKTNLIKIFLEAGAPVDQADDLLKSALSYTVQQQQITGTKYLLALNAQVTRDIENEAVKQQNTIILHMILWHSPYLYMNMLYSAVFSIPYHYTRDEPTYTLTIAERDRLKWILEAGQSIPVTHKKNASNVLSTLCSRVDFSNDWEMLQLILSELATGNPVNYEAQVSLYFNSFINKNKPEPLNKLLTFINQHSPDWLVPRVQSALSKLFRYQYNADIVKVIFKANLMNEDNLEKTLNLIYLFLNWDALELLLQQRRYQEKTAVILFQKCVPMYQSREESCILFSKIDKSDNRLYPSSTINSILSLPLHEEHFIPELIKIRNNWIASQIIQYANKNSVKTVKMILQHPSVNADEIIGIIKTSHPHTYQFIQKHFPLLTHQCPLPSVGFFQMAKNTELAEMPQTSLEHRNTLTFL